MKNNLFFATALFLATAAGAQTTTTTTPVTSNPAITSAVVETSTIVDTIALKGLTTETLRPEHVFPVLGNYKASGTSITDVTITLDSVNKGIVWVDGLPQGKFKALMKKAPATYKIPAQKTESGKPVSEGTLFLNPASKELTIVLGRPFDDADPTSFSTNVTKTKSKAWQYTATKL